MKKLLLRIACAAGALLMACSFVGCASNDNDPDQSGDNQQTEQPENPSTPSDPSEPEEPTDPEAVSYTHLTLPTNSRV